MFSAIAISIALFGAIDAYAQPNGENADAKTPVVFTTKQDHEIMLDQLGITKLRPGRNANADSPNAAN
jgi:hypothetical protein